MKKIFLTMAIIIAGYCSYAQTNTFPSTGNVGIGTTSPFSKTTISVTSTNSISTADVSNTAGLTVAGVGDQVRLQLGVGSNTIGPYGSWIQSSYDNGSGGNGTQALLLNPIGGNVGIGTTNPSHKLQVNNVANDRIATFVGGASASTILALYVADSGASVGTDSNTQLGFYTNGTTAMTILPSKNVGIGTTTRDTKLAVNGTIHTKEVKVDMSGWPDYVFKPAYSLLSLAEVKTYLAKNQHLPDMPSAEEVAKNGLNLGEMNKLLTKKVEELTLYAIDQQKKSDQQAARIAALEKALKKLTGYRAISR